jgi:ribosomal protein L32
MKISLWPEYDDPRILVLYEGEFADGSGFPQQVAFPAPLGSDIGQVCALTKPANEHLCQLYETTTEGDSIAISYSLPIPTFFLEYYYDGLQGQPDKTFSYQYVSAYPIERLDIEVQQPLKSSGFSLSPAHSTAGSAGGFTYYQYAFNDVEPGQVINIDGSYSKSDSKPSVAGQQQAAGGSSSTLRTLGIVVAIAAVGVVGVMAYRRRTPVPARARSTASRQVRRAAERTAGLQHTRNTDKRKASGASFCTNCGEKLGPDNNFCPECGARKHE